MSWTNATTAMTPYAAAKIWNARSCAGFGTARTVRMGRTMRARERGPRKSEQGPRDEPGRGRRSTTRRRRRRRRGARGARRAPGEGRDTRKTWSRAPRRVRQPSTARPGKNRRCDAAKNLGRPTGCPTDRRPRDSHHHQVSVGSMRSPVRSTPLPRVGSTMSRGRAKARDNVDVLDHVRRARSSSRLARRASNRTRFSDRSDPRATPTD
jgi:hypothetical protein